MKLIINKQVCSQYNLGIHKEWFESNQLGTYSASTIYGLNSHPYHGLFVIPLTELNKHTVILSKFEESIFVGTRVYEISTNQFKGGIHPHGYRYLEEFRVDPFPKFIFRIEHRRIEKTVFLLHDKNILLVRYANKNHGIPVKLIIKPIIAGRKTDELTKEIAEIITESYSDGRVVKIAPKPNVPELKIYHSKGEFFQAPLWYHDFKYITDYEEQNGSENKTEDLFNPGFLTCTLDAYESCDLFLSIDDINNFDYEAYFRKEKEYRRKISSKIRSFSAFSKDIYEAVRSFRISNQGKFPLQLINYPDFKMTSREMLLLLPGLLLVEGNINKIKKVIDYFSLNLNDGLFPEDYPAQKSSPPASSADVGLLFINFAYHFIKYTGDDDYLEHVLLPMCKSIIDAYNKGTHSNIYKDKDHLVYVGNKDVDTSWIRLKDSKGQVLRYGKLLEINALWFNGLKIMEFMYQEVGKNRLAKRYSKMANQTQSSFIDYFYDNSTGKFFDLIRFNRQDQSFRINQLFLVGLPFSMLNRKMGENLLKMIDKELLTPYGLRSLSVTDENFQGQLDGYITPYHSEYYLGTIWPWTIGIYTDAVLKVLGYNNTVTNYLKKILLYFKDLFYKEGLGYISELFEGEMPYRKNGRLVYSLNLTELFRAVYTLRMIKKKDASEYELRG